MKIPGYMPLSDTGASFAGTAILNWWEHEPT